MDGTTMKIPADFDDLVETFESRGVRYLIIGGYAVGVHAQPRATKDMDFLLEASRENLKRASDAVRAFGVPPHIPGQIVAMRWDDLVWRCAVAC